MKNRISYCIFIVLSLCLFPVSVHAAPEGAYSFGHFYYHSYDGYVSICGYLGRETDITIPSSISGKPVSEIEAGAFDGCDTIKTIVIPDTVTTVHGNSFTGASSLEKIVSHTVGINIPVNDNVVVEYTDPNQEEKQAVIDDTNNQEKTEEEKKKEEESIEEKIKEAEKEQKPKQDPKDDTGSKDNKDNNKEKEKGNTNSDIDEGYDVEDDSEKGSSVEIISNPSDQTITVKEPDKEYTLSVDENGNLVKQDSKGNSEIVDNTRKYDVKTTEDGEVTIIDENGNVYMPDSVSVGNETISSATDIDDQEETSDKNKILVPVGIVLLCGVILGAVVLVRKRSKT